MLREELEQYLRRFGSHALAYSALQQGMAHFTKKDVGYIPYSKLKLGKTVAYGLSNPICEAGNYSMITEMFLEKYPSAAFIQVTEEYAEVLDRLGFYVNELGYETEISIKDFTYSGRVKEDVRRGLKDARRRGMEVLEMDDPRPYAGELEAISQEWISTKAVDDRELCFVARPAVYTKEPGVRKFVARQGGRIEGFAFFDPMYAGGRVYGFHLDILRARRASHPGTIRLIVQCAMERFRAEGHAVLSLGISPQLHAGSERFNPSPYTRRILELLYKYGNRLYPFKGLSFAKSRYGGGMTDGEYRDASVSKKKVYFAHRSKIPIREIYGASKLTGVVSGVLPTLKRLMLSY